MFCYVRAGDELVFILMDRYVMLLIELHSIAKELLHRRVSVKVMKKGQV